MGEETINFLKERTLSADGETKMCGPGGQHSTMDSILASHPLALGSILGVPKDLFHTKMLSIDVAEIH